MAGSEQQSRAAANTAGGTGAPGSPEADAARTAPTLRDQTRQRLGIMRRNAGKQLRPTGRLVLVPPPAIRGGNYLFCWLWAHAHPNVFHGTVVEHRANMADWLEEFPALEELTTDPEQPHSHDVQWPFWTMKIGTEFTEQQVKRFVRRRLLSSPRFAQRLAAADAARDLGELLINVRRGATGAGIFGDFAELAAARRLILTNSTFSYWGALVGDARTPGRRVLAPRQHERGPGGVALNHLPRAWHLLDVEWDAGETGRAVSAAE